MSMPSIEGVRVLAARCAAAGDAELEQAFEERFALPLQRFCAMDQVQQVEYLQGLQDGYVQRPNPQVHTPQFKAWFGDSKVVDAYGRPLVVYHGTGEDVSVFKPAAHGIYFTTDLDYAESYAPGWRGGRGNIMPVHLSIKNPLVRDTMPRKDAEKIVSEAIRNGHDGIYVPAAEGGFARGMWIAFNPNQIKSAIGNSGSFDANNPDITDGAGRELLKRLVQPNIGCSVVNAARASGVPTIFFSP